MERKLEATTPHQTRSAAVATRVGLWTALDSSWYKINFDGAVFVKEDKVGLGVVIQLRGFGHGLAFTVDFFTLLCS